MTTTYELYTNENGTPKAVEGKAPAILERVETLEETLDNGVVTSVNGNTGDITPEQMGCLPLSGGTVTDAIYGEGGIIRGKTDASDVWISGGTNSSSNSYIQINGGSRTNQAGDIIIVTKTPTGSYSLRATASGTLTWGGKDVITNAGGAYITNNVMRREVDTSHLDIFGGTGYLHGAHLSLRGKDKDGDGGNFILSSIVDGKSASLVGEPNGSLTWANSKVVTLAKPLVPNYGAGVAISSGYTAPSAGIVIVKSVGNYSGYTSINVNGHEVAVYKTTSQLDSSGTAWVNKGDKIEFRNGGSASNVRFYPLKIGG